MSFLSTLLVFYLQISNAEYSFVQCAFLGPRLIWKAGFTCPKNITASACIDSSPKLPAPTQPLLPAYTTSTPLPFDPLSPDGKTQLKKSKADVTSAEATIFMNSTPLVIFSTPASSSPIGEPDSMITPPATAFESFLALQLSTALFESFLALDSSAAPDCRPIPCQIICNTVNILYPPYQGLNTACVSTAGGFPSAADVVQQMTSIGLLPSEPPFVEVVFLYIGANDGCKKIGTSFINFKTKFYPGELSSIRDGATSSFNFADLPCPPESVYPHQYGTYNPRIALPTFVTDLDSAWKTCTIGPSEGFDPPVLLTKVTSLSDNTQGGPFGVKSNNRREA